MLSRRLSPAGDEPCDRPRLLLFRAPTGLADGLALKELRYDAAEASIRPILLGPPLLTFRERIRRCLDCKLAQPAAVCPAGLWIAAAGRRSACRREATAS